MPARSFALATTWNLTAPIERVWEALRQVEHWPKWWPYVRRVHVIRAGDQNGVGAMQRFTWGSALPYRLDLTMHVTEMRHLEVIAASAEGDLRGTGRWTLQPQHTGTRVDYDWQVDVTRSWMAGLAPLMAPVFRWNHGKVMAAGERGLSALLAGPSVSHLEIARNLE